MSTLSQFLGSATSGSYVNKRVIMYSSDFIVPSGVTKIRAHAFGGGGSGAMVANNSGYAGGGAGGGYSAYDFTVVPATTMNVVVGSGGTAVRNPQRGSLKGNAGGNTSVTYGSKTIYAYGGDGGANTLNGTINNIGVGAAGGGASGGTLNVPGGNCHFITFSGFTSTTQYFLASGGGAAGNPMYGTPGNGSITFANTTLTGSNTAAAFGGIGLGGWHYSTNTSPAGIWIGQIGTGGGGTSPIRWSGYYAAIGTSGLPGYGATTYAALGQLGYGINTDFSELLGSSIFMNLYGQGGAGGSVNYPGYNGAAGAGGGGTAIYMPGTIVTNYGGNGGSLGGGGGGCLFTDTPSYSMQGGKGGYAAGGGGVVVNIVDTSVCSSGKGGDGLVILEW